MAAKSEFMRAGLGGANPLCSMACHDCTWGGRALKSEKPYGCCIMAS